MRSQYLRVDRVFGAAVAAATAALGVSALAQEPATSEAVREPFVGAYSLVEYAAHGDEPTGMIWYEPNGHMSAMLFQPGREPPTNDMSADELRAATRGVVAYYGTYTVDVEAGTVTHHVRGASNPAWVGDDFVRWYRFEDGNLRLSLNSDFRGTLLWQQIPAATE
jgi:hypothetical protein